MLLLQLLMSYVENFLLHIESWIDSHTFELFSVPRDGSFLISVVLIVELYILVLEVFLFLKDMPWNLYKSIDLSYFHLVFKIYFMLSTEEVL